MIPRSPATAGLRIIALVILIPAMFRLGTLVFLMLPGHAGAQPTNPIIAPSFDRSPGTKVVRTIPSSSIAWLVTRVAGGVVVLIFAKPVVDLGHRRAIG